MKVLSQVQQAVKNGRFDEAREVLNEQSQTFPTNGVGPSFIAEPEEEIDISYADLQKDYGGGRVSRGLIFLEIVSLGKRGKNTNSLLLFDRIPQYASVRALDVAQTKEDKVSFVAVSLGVQNLVSELREYTRDLHDSVENKFEEVFDQVNTGTFLRRNNNDVLSILRKSVRTLRVAKERIVIR